MGIQRPRVTDWRRNIWRVVVDNFPELKTNINTQKNYLYQVEWFF